MLSFHARYLAGEHEQVWDELLALGPRVRHARYYDDAVAVARETMQRVRRNCEVLIPRLEHLGWQFGYAWAGAWAAEDIKREPPRLGQPADTSRLDAIEARNGLLPIALRAFYEIVGALNFVGLLFSRRGWPGIAYELDPLYVAGIEEAFDQDNTPVGYPSNEVFIAPDPLPKYYISGTGRLYVEIPCADADALLMFEATRFQMENRDVTLVRYLRYALQGGGFTTFLWEPKRIPEADLAYLTAGLEPI